MHPRNHGSTWPTNGVASARYTRGSIEDGPGVSISRFGGFSSPMWELSLMFSASKKRGPNFRPARLPPATDNLESLSGRRRVPKWETAAHPHPFFRKDVILSHLYRNNAQGCDSREFTSPRTAGGVSAKWVERS